MNDSPLVNWFQLDAIADGWNEEFLEIYEEFLTDVPKDLEELAGVLSQNDAEGVAKIAHRTKGCVANFGFERVRHAAYAIEQKAKDGDLSGAVELLQQAREAFQAAALEVEQVRANQPDSRDIN